MKSLNLTGTKMTPIIKVLKSLSIATLVVASMTSVVVFAQETMYQKGQRQLDSKEYQVAQETFALLAKQKDAKQDAALYWLAYAQFKGKLDQKALKTIAQLTRDHQQSSWLDDAQALKVEIQDKGGKSVEFDNEEMKLYALDSLMNSPSEKSLKILENIIAGNSSVQVKKRALFVLSQSDGPEVVKIIEALAKDDSNESLQNEAINVLGISGASGAIASLKEIYQTTTSERVKLKVIHSYMLADEGDELLALARSETNPQLKTELIRMVGVMSNPGALLEMYRDPAFTDFRHEILEGFAIGGGAEALFEVVKSEKDQELLLDAVKKMGILDESDTGQYLTNIYQGNNNNAVRSSVITAMFIQSNVNGLTDIIKLEKDPELKREALRKLSLMDSDEALQYFDAVLQDDGVQ